jgi:hypothetical protein
MERILPSKYSAIFSGEISPRGNKKVCSCYFNCKNRCSKNSKVLPIIKIKVPSIVKLVHESIVKYY